MIVQTLLGSAAEPAHLTTLEVCVHSLVVVGLAMVAVRIAARRFAPEALPYDVIAGVLLGSILSQIINGPSSVIPTAVCAVLLVLTHWLAGRVSLRRRHIADFLKGRSIAPAQDGRSNAHTLRRNRIPEPDLDQALRFWGGVADLKEARLVALERRGHLSVVSRR